MAINSDVTTTYKAIDKSRSATTSFITGMKRVSSSVLNLKTAIVGAVGAAGLGYMIKKQMEEIDAAAKMADRLNMATEELVAFQHGAELSGVATSSLNKGLEIFSRRLGEVQMGTGEAQRALDLLNLSADDLADLSPDKAIYEVADAINELETQSQKAAAANYLFGRSGQQLLNLFDKGSRGLMAYRDEVDKLGLSFSRIDAAKVEAANDAMTRARRVFTGLQRTATIEIAPYIERAATAFTEFATSGEGVGAKMMSVFEGMSLGVTKVGSLTRTLPAYWYAVEAASRQSLAAVYDMAGAMTNLDELFKGLKRPGWEQTYKELAAGQRTKAAQLMEQGGKALAEAIEAENRVQQWFDDVRNRQGRTAGSSAMSADAAMEAMFPGFSKMKAEISAVAGDNAWFGLGRKVSASFDQAGTAARKFFYEVKSSGLDALDTTVKAAEQWRCSLDAAEQSAQTVRDRTAALARMYDAMGIYDERAYAVRMSLLNQEVAEFRKLKISETDIALYQLERQREALEEHARRSQDLLAGMNAAFIAMDRGRMTLGEFGYQAAHTMRDEMANMFDAVTLEGASWRDAMTSYFTDVGRAWVRMINEMAAQQMFQSTIQPAYSWLTSAITAGVTGGFTGGSTASAPTLGSPGVTGPHVLHGGGIVGVTKAPTRLVDPSVFAHAERRHAGLRHDEVAAILTKSEVVGTPEQIGGMVHSLSSPKGEIHIHLENQSGANLDITKKSDLVDGENRIINLIINSLDTHPGLVHAVQNAAMR